MKQSIDPREEARDFVSKGYLAMPGSAMYC